MGSGQGSPFSFLREQDQRYRDRGVLPADEKPAGEEWTGLLFRIKDASFLSSMAVIQEMVPQWEVTPIPGVKPWVLGLMNLHGNLVTVIDLEGFFFGKNISTYSADPKLMVVTQGNYSVGLVVSEVFGMKHFWAMDRAPTPQGIAEEVAPFVGMSFNRHGEHYAVFDVEALMADERFRSLSL
ncbi:MAG: chemotaxis protein CheW [bacterium]